MLMATMAESRFAVLVADAVWEEEFFVDIVHGLLLFFAAGAPLASTCHATLPRGVLFLTLSPGAASSFLVLVLGFIMVAVLLGLVILEPAALLLRAVAVGSMFVVKVAIVGVKEQNLPLPSSWESSMLAGGAVVHA